MWTDRLDDASRLNARMLGEARRRGCVVFRSAAGSMQALVNWRRGRILEEEADSSLALDGDGAERDAVLPLVGTPRAGLRSQELPHGADALLSQGDARRVSA
jgi:hypothetical protein